MIGLLVENGEDQDMVNNINAFNRNNCCHVFSASIIPQLQTTVLQRYEAFHFNGTIITNKFRLAQQLRHLGYCKKRFYYIKEYEWLNTQVLPYKIVKDTLLHPSIDIIVDNQSQVKFIEDLTNKKVKYIMNNWDINVLRQIADE